MKATIRKPTQRPSSYFGFDTEDDSQGRPHLFCIVGEDGQRGTYHDAESFREVLTHLALAEKAAGRRAEFWAVNLSYDLHNVYWPGMDATLPTFNRMGRVIAARLLGTDALFRDTVAFLPASAKQLGEMVGLPKLDFAPNDAEYCLRDAEIALRAGLLLRAAFDGAGVTMRYSAAGTAMAAWESRVGAPREPEEWCRSAYYGGRVETLRTGMIPGPVYRWDVRSMYPSSMLGVFPLPGSSVDGWQEGKPAWVAARVTVPDDGRIAGPLPCREQLGGITFPVGTFEGAWVSDELEAGIERGAVVERVITARTWTATCRPFDDWTRDIYALRSQSPTLKVAAKILLNSLYGKFGAGTEMMSVRKGPLLPYRWGDAYTFGICEMGAFPPSTRFAFAAFTTARARVKLLQLIEKCKRPIYCDTDSVFAMDDDLRELESEGLGGLERLETAEAMDILSPKVYRVKTAKGWDYKAKGIPLGLALESPEEFWQSRTVHFRAPSTMRQALAKGERPGIWFDQQKEIRASHGGRRKSRGSKTLPPLKGD